MINQIYNFFYWLIRKFKNQIFLNQWQILFSFSDSIDFNFENFQIIQPPKDRFWADPFVMEHENKFVVFFEELVYNENKGVISCLEIDKNGNISNIQKVLEKEYHLSYPFIFNNSGNLFMIPETIENRTIELYKCNKFPDIWVLQEILINDIEAVDTTILYHNSIYWLFANVKNLVNDSTWDELHLFFSDNLINGNWTSHPLNPIVSDVSSSRPAGKIYKKNNKIIRPAQNCSLHYGYGIELNEITILNKNNYEEKNIGSLHPTWSRDVNSIHTINHISGITVIDAQLNRNRFF